MNNTIHSLTIQSKIPCSPGNITAFRADLIEHAAITFLSNLWDRFPKEFSDLMAIEILDVLFKKKVTREIGKKDQIDQVIKMLYEIYPEFRLFHNHEPDSNYYNYSYPLIHYRTKINLAQIVAFNEAVPIVKHWIMMVDPASWVNLNHVQFSEQNEEIQISDTPVYYRLMDWNALSRQNYYDWKHSHLMKNRLSILEKALTGHLRALAVAFLPGTDVDRIHGEIVLLKNVRKETAFGTPGVVCNILFRTHLDLPPCLALGRTVSIGYGTQKKTRWQGESVKVNEEQLSQIELESAPS